MHRLSGVLRAFAAQQKGEIWAEGEQQSGALGSGQGKGAPEVFSHSDSQQQ